MGNSVVALTRSWSSSSDHLSDELLCAAEDGCLEEVCVFANSDLCILVEKIIKDLRILKLFTELQKNLIKLVLFATLIIRLNKDGSVAEWLRALI